MNKKINLLILTLVIIFTNIQTSYAYTFQNWGPADVLKVTFRKLEICTGSNALEWSNKEVTFWLNERALTDEFCNDPIVLGKGDKVIDVASVDAGLTAGTYGEAALLPLGETFTHVRLTVDRKFTLKNKLDANGKGINTGGSAETSSCMTKTTTDGMYGFDLARAPTPNTWTEEVWKYKTIPAIDESESGTPEEMDVYYVFGNSEKDGLPYSQVWQCFDEECDEGSLLTWWYCFLEEDCGSGLNKGAIGMSIPTDDDTFIPEDDIVLIFELKNPYTITTSPPIFNIKFGTQKGVVANEVSKTGSAANSWVPQNNDGKCAMRMGWFHVKIEMKDQKVRRRRGTWR